MHPETAFEEFETTARVMAELEAVGLSPRPVGGVATGCTAVLQGNPGDKVLGLRADMDALNITEENDVPYRSQKAGKMHACGHDGHTTVLLGAAKRLVEEKSRLYGKVKFIFQPAEEGVRGAKALVAGGVLDEPPMDRILACHMYPELKAGQVGLIKGASHASSDRFDLVIHGRGGHAAAPHTCIDPVLAGAHFVVDAQSIVSRNVPPLEPAVISIGLFEGGTAANVIPERVHIRGTVRAFNPAVRSLADTRLEALARGLERSFGVTCDYRFEEGVPALINDEAIVEELYELCRGVLGDKNVFFIAPRLGGEDFSLYAERIPAAMLRLGCGFKNETDVRALHTPRFDIAEEALAVGVELLSQAALNYLKAD